MGIIKSLLDTDLYKFTMMQAVYHQCPGTMVEYQFKLRNSDLRLDLYEGQIKREIKDLCKLRFTHKELDFLSSLRFIKQDFIDLLRIFHLEERYVDVHVDFHPPINEPELVIKIAGPWLHTILFEVPVLAIVNEVYFSNLLTESKTDWDDLQLEGHVRLANKISMAKKYGAEIDSIVHSDEPLSPYLITDFGTRRRFSLDWHREVVATLKANLPRNFVGTSNAMLAMENGITPFGTMAHEWLQAPQGFDGVQLAASQRYALQKWADEYRGDLGIALSDIVGFDAFLRDFDLYFMKLFDGCRHDSGDPAEWCRRLIKHYEANKIDPTTKRAVFSDGLTIPKTIELHREFRDQIGLGFGIGTNLTNDCGPQALQIVIKLTKVNGKPVAKVSDSKGKTMCEDGEYLSYLRKVFKIKQDS